ncbi:DNA-directed RNA polymerase sigma-70 factor [Haloferula helveola]|uniref:DNA-directed RNA polymerase sigma-70 factor n=1 Tax=Haloferula helveola TaxID=490095 RepID=A0ABN6GZ57_9BACT|nr:DNA-directed RNA polymerase sigma-70 factor [Haloferula helveola]
MQNDEFAREITGSQQRLFGYIFSLLGDEAASWDVLQETNLVLWRKQADFRAGSNFGAWASTVARFQVLAYLRDRSRDKTSVLTAEVLEALAAEAELADGQFDGRRDALRDCLAHLNGSERSLIRRFYHERHSTQSIAEESGGNPNSVKQALFRVRRKLAHCIDQRLAT